MTLAPSPRLSKAVKSGPAKVSEVAVYALGFCAGGEAAQALRDQFNSGDRFVRYNTALARARWGDADAVPILREMLSPTDLDKVITMDSPTEKRGRSRRSSWRRCTRSKPPLTPANRPWLRTCARRSTLKRGRGSSAFATRRALVNSLDRSK